MLCARSAWALNGDYKEVYRPVLQAIDPAFDPTLPPNEELRVVTSGDAVVGYFIVDKSQPELRIRRFASKPGQEADVLRSLYSHLRETGPGRRAVVDLQGADTRWIASFREGGFSEETGPSAKGAIRLRTGSLPGRKLDYREMKASDAPSIVEREAAAKGVDSEKAKVRFERLTKRKRASVRVIQYEGAPIGHVVLQQSTDKVVIQSLVLTGPSAEQALSLLLWNLKLDELKGRSLEVAPRAATQATLDQLADHGFRSVQVAGKWGVPAERLRFSLEHEVTSELAQRHPFARLGVGANATVGEVERAFEKLALRNAGRAPVLKLLDEARQTLIDRAKRAAYLSENREALLSSGVFSNIKAPGDPDLYARLGLDPNAPAESVEWALINAELVHGKQPALDLAHRVLGDADTRRLYDTIVQTTEGADRQGALERFYGKLGPRAQAAPQPAAVVPAASWPNHLRVTTAKPLHANFYQRLGVAENASADAVMSAYIDARLKYEGQAAETAALEDAYRVLRWPELRRQYDELVREGATEGISALVAKSPSLTETKASFEEKLTRPARRLKFSSARPGALNLYQRLGMAENATRPAILAARDAALAEMSYGETERAALVEASRVLTNPLLRESYDLLSAYWGEDAQFMREKIPVLASGDFRKVKALIQDKTPTQSNKFELLRKIGDHLRAPDEPVGDRRIENLYTHLGIGENATAETIEKAYSELPLPNRTLDAEYAYLVLRNVKLRKRYDRLVRESDRRDEEGNALKVGELKSVARRASLTEELERLTHGSAASAELFAQGKEMAEALSGTRPAAAFIERLARQAIAEKGATPDLRGWLAEQARGAAMLRAEHLEEYSARVIAASASVEAAFAPPSGPPCPYKDIRPKDSST